MTTLRVFRMTLQVVSSPTCAIQITLEVPFMLLENIYSTNDDRIIFKVHWTNLQGTNALAYYKTPVNYDRKSYVRLVPGPWKMFFDETGNE